MKSNILTLAALLLAVVACSPQVYPLYLDVRQPSSSGLDLGRKSISIVYSEGAASRDSLFDRCAASSLARALEADYFGGEEVVGLYHIPSADTVTVELMRSLVMDTNSDVVFYLSSSLDDIIPEVNQPVRGAASPDSAYVCPVNVPVNTTLKVYDSMGDDNVLSFKGNAIMRPLVYNNGMVSDQGFDILALRSLSPKAEEMGERIARRFLSNWKTESFSFYYYEQDAWYKPLESFADGKFTAAVDAWGTLAKRGDALHRASAAFNIAQALYLMEDYEMSARWLDLAEKTENLSLSSGLRKRLNVHLEKFQK